MNVRGNQAGTNTAQGRWNPLRGLTFGIQPRSKTRLALVIGLLLGSLTMLGSNAANAVGESLTVVLTQQDGAAPFNADSAAGHDANDSNGIVRTNDNLTYHVEVRVDTAASTDTTFTMELPQGVEMTQVPAFCTGDGSGLTPTSLGEPVVPVTATSWTSLPRQTLVCNVGDRTANSTFTYPIVTKVRPEVPNGTVLTLDTVSATTTDVTTPAESNPVTATVSARAQFDISKNNIALTENTGYINSAERVVSNCPDPLNGPTATRRCFSYRIAMLVSAPAGGKGSSPMSGDFSFLDDLTPASFYPASVLTDPDWIAAGPDAAAKYGALLGGCFRMEFQQPGMKVGITGAEAGATPLLTEADSVRDSGTTTCTQAGGPGTPVTVSVANADTTAYTYPTHLRRPETIAIPANQAYVYSYGIRFFIPVDAVADLGTPNSPTDPSSWNLAWDNKFTGFAPTDIGGLANDPEANPAWNDHRASNSVLQITGPYETWFSGIPGATGNTPPIEFSPGFPVWEGPAGSTGSQMGEGQIYPGATTLGTIYNVNESSTGDTLTHLSCGSWDPAITTLTNRVEPGGELIPGSTAGQSMQKLPSTGAPVWPAGFYRSVEGTPTTPSPGFRYEIEYGTGVGGPGAGSECDDDSSPDGWFTDAAAVPGNDPALLAQGMFTAVTRVRIRSVLPLENDLALSAVSYHIGLGTNPSLTTGDVIPLWGTNKIAVGERSIAEMASVPWRTRNYDPSTNTGSYGDRLRAALGVARLSKQVKDPGSGEFGTSTPAFTGGQIAEFRLQPTITTSIQTDATVHVMVEDCLPAGEQFQAATASPAATIVAPDAPADAELTCDPGETYVRWDLGQQPVSGTLPAITYSARVANGAQAGTKINRALVTAEGDNSTVAQRSAQASILVQQPAGIVVDKVSLTPQIEVNRAGETALDPLLWRIDFANVNSDPGPTDVDIIDQLPKQGEGGTHFNGTLAFDSATVTAGDEPGQAVEVLYTRQPNVDVDPGNTTNNATTGSTVWCSLSGTTFTRVLGGGTSSACPTSVAEVTGLRIRRPGAFGPSDLISVEIQMTPSSNRAGDVYVNETAGRATGLALLVGPAEAPATVVASSIGDYVWEDANVNGVQDDGEEPIADFPVRLTGTDSDGNPVGPLNTTTDATGKYSFTGLQSGEYTVTFLPSGLGADQRFTLQDQGANDLADSDGDPTTGVATVTLAANTANLSVDQGVFTADPDIEVIKFINGDDANTAPGVLVEPGEDMDVTFDVTNTGNIALNPVALTDDTIDSADIVCPQTTLAAGETMTCTAVYPGPAAGTQHTNVATVTGTPVPLPDGTQLPDVTDDDPANAYGIVRQVDITKEVVGDPVPNGDGTWTIDYDVVVTNEGTQAATYDLDDELHFGEGATVIGASVASGPAGVTLNPAWNGLGDTRIATGVNIAIDGVHTYRVRATASIDETIASTGSSDCELTQGETGTGFLNGATLTFEGDTTEVDACPPFPVIDVDKTIVGTPVANGDGTYTVTYDVVATNSGAGAGTYDLTDTLAFGDNITVESATVANTAPGSITTDPAWNGIDDVEVVSDEAIGPETAHTYRVTVVARVGRSITLEQSDCVLQDGEDGTGFLNETTLTSNGEDSDDDDCGAAPNTAMTKELFGDPVVEDDDTVTATYVITVTNTGAGDDTYDLDDELQFGPGITVNSATVSNTEPGDLTVNAAWDGAGDTEVVAGQAIASGATHRYVVIVNSTIGTTTTGSQADCTLTTGEDGTGFLNGATLTVNGETSVDDACGEVDPIIEMDKALVGTPVRNADGTWEITYDIDVTNRIAPNEYDLLDELTYGDGIVVEGATVSNTAPGDLTTRESWNGLDDTLVVQHRVIGAGVTHTYRVTVTATVPTTATSTTTDCTVGGDETGTGFLNKAQVTTETQDLRDEDCAPAPNVSIVKDLVGDPVVNDDNTVDLAYVITVTNDGAGADAYDLDDELLFGNDITVNSAAVANDAPGDVATNPAWDGIADTSVATDVTIAGAGAEPVTHTYTVTVNATIGTGTSIAEADCTLDAGEEGTGFLNNAVLTIDEHTQEDDACGDVDPEIVVEKEIVGAPTANGDGTWTIEYDITATNVGPTPGAYDLDDELTYGKDVTVVAAEVANTDPGDIDTNPGWDGLDDLDVVDDVPLAVAGTHTYRVTVDASVAPSLTTAASDCTSDAGEAGTGFLNTTSLTYEGGSSDDDTCAEIPKIGVMKKIEGTPTVSATGAVDVTYALTVSNTGEGDGTYRLDDEIRWGAGLTVTAAEVTASPAGQTADPSWNGISETLIADEVDLGAGATHVWKVRVTGQRSATMTSAAGDCTLAAGENGTGLLNTATVTSNGVKADSSDCGPVQKETPKVPQRTARTGNLPVTGSQLMSIALAGVVLLAAGLLLRGAARGRRRTGAG